MPYSKREKRAYLKMLNRVIGDYMKDSIEEQDKRWEATIKHQPDRYQIAREKDGSLKVVFDTDSGYLYMKLDHEGKKIWVTFP